MQEEQTDSKFYLNKWIVPKKKKIKSRLLPADNPSTWNLLNLCELGFEFVSSARLLLLSFECLSFVVYCSAECVYLSVGSTIKEKLHVHGTDNTDWPPAGDTFAGANLSQKQTVTKFFSASIN